MAYRLKKYWLSVLFASFFFAGAQAQIEASAGLDSSHAETGNPFTVHITVPNSAARPGQIDFSAWSDEVPPQNIVKQSEWTPMGQSFTKDLTLLFFDEDTLSLPPLSIPFSNGDTARTNPLDIIILSTPSPDDLLDMSDIKDIHREPALWTDYLPWALAIAGFFLFLVLVSWLIGRTRKKQTVASRTIELPPHELALKKLAALEQKQLWNKGLVKEFCAELTFIVREYLEKRFHVPALESTSEELLNSLKTTGFPEPLHATLQDILTQADLAKFAKSVPPESFEENARQFAKNLIDMTKNIVGEHNDHLQT